PMTIPAPSPPAPDPLGWLNNQPYLLLSLTSLFWAGNIVLGRYVAGHVPPLTLSCVRWIGAFLILLPFAWGHLKCDWLALRGDFAALAAIQFNKGDVMFAAALLVFGLYSALMLRRPKMHQLSLISFTTGCGALLLLPFSIWEFSTGFTLKFDALTIATLIY